MFFQYVTHGVHVGLDGVIDDGVELAPILTENVGLTKEA